MFRTAPYGDLGLDGNAVAIIGSSGVLVFDTNGTPSAAAVTPAPPDLPHLKKALVAIAPIPPK